jgi:uncharacterized protein YqhQ
VGGQAVLEGVMMRGVSTWAVAVRKPPADPGADVAAAADGAEAAADGAEAPVDGAGAPADGAEAAADGAEARAVAEAPVAVANGSAAGATVNGSVAVPGPNRSNGPAPAAAADTPVASDIAVTSFPLVSWTRKRRAYRLPLIRGVVAMAESLSIGMRALSISASAQLPEGEEDLSGGAWTGAVIVATLFAVAVFFVLPIGLTSLIKDQLGSSFTFWLIEGLVRTAIFLGYLMLLSRIRDLRRVFEYHGAEHKVISCYEADDKLVPERAKLYSRLHPRCGTSFLLIVMIVAIFVFAPIGLPAWYLLVITRIVGIPIIAGVSFEIIKWAGRNRRHAWVRAVMFPGLQLQKLTTREPDLDQLAVAIAALQAVLAVETPGAASAKDLVGIELVA